MLPSHLNENPFDSTTNVRATTTFDVTSTIESPNQFSYSSPEPEHFIQIDKRVIEAYGSVLGPYGIAIYLVLASLAGPLGVCSPSIAKLSKTIHISEQTTRVALKKLHAQGLIDIVATYSSNGGQRANQYVLRQVDL